MQAVRYFFVSYSSRSNYSFTSSDVFLTEITQIALLRPFQNKIFWGNIYTPENSKKKKEPQKKFLVQILAIKSFLGAVQCVELV